MKKVADCGNDEYGYEYIKRKEKTTTRENQDGGVGRHTAPPCTTRTDRKSNGKEVQHPGDKK